ncbi:MAG: hypothetical protein IJY57_03975 [Clostridia bacterium]|nr:hypothetical protein [Clostridia bacterium]
MTDGNGYAISLVKRDSVTTKLKVERTFVFFVLFFSIFMEVFINYLKFPSLIRFLNDLAIVLLFITSISKVYHTFKRLKLTPVLIAVGVFFLLGVISAIINMVSTALYIWAFRNTFRGILYFAFVVTYLDEVDIKNIFNVLYYISFLHLALCLYQYFALGLKQDMLGGVFGSVSAMEPTTFMVILLSYYLIAYIEKKEKFRRLVFVLVSSMIISALAEERLAFIVFLCILLASLFLTGFSTRKFIVFIVAIGALGLGLYIVSVVFPDVFETLIDFENMFEYATATWEDSYGIPRIGAFTFINEHFFKDDTLRLIFGYGFGQTETSELSIFQSEFYKLYGDYKYRWFTHQWVYLEGGITGIVSYFSIFITVLVCIIRKRKQVSGYSKTLLLVGIIVAAYCILLTVYNSTLKNDMSYIAFFGMAIGLIGTKSPCVVKKS